MLSRRALLASSAGAAVAVLAGCADADRAGAVHRPERQRRADPDTVDQR